MLPKSSYGLVGILHLVNYMYLYLALLWPTIYILRSKYIGTKVQLSTSLLNTVKRVIRHDCIT